MEQIVNTIRDVLRKEGITGMESINHCIVFVIARMLDESICNKVNIDKKFSYKNMMQDDDGDEIEPTDLMTKFYVKNKIDCLIGQLVNKLGFKNIKFKLESPENLKIIMKKMKNFDTKTLESTYDIIGTIYEIHLKSGTSNAMRDLGQYYTHRLVINYMIKLCDPKMDKNGNIDKIVDPTMGTGGFLTMAIKYLNDKYKNKIDWTKNKNNILGFDIDENVRNMALLNVFLEIGELCENTIVKQDSLHKDLLFTDGPNKGKILEKAKIILANEPMGLKNIIHASCCDRIKNLKIRGTKAEPLFLQLFCELLDDDGKCAVIIPDGVLFNDSSLHCETRKYIIENFDLKKIIALDDGFFLNTGVKTSIMYFEKNGKKTKEVEYSIIKLYDRNIKENSIINVKYDDIKKNGFSLSLNKFMIKNIENFKDIKYYKIKEICNFQNKSKRNASFGSSEGQYNFYTSGINIKKCDVVDYTNESLIIGTGGNASIKCDSNFSCSADNFVLEIKDNSIALIKYIYYYLFSNINLINDGFKGSTIKHLSRDFLEDLKIPVPVLEVQKKIIESLNVLSENTNTLKNNITHFKKIVNFHIESATYSHSKNIRLGDIFDLEKGKLQSTKIEIGEKIPVLSISEAIKYTDKIDEILIVKGENIWICSVSSGTSNGPYETKIKYFNGSCSFTNLLSRFVVKKEYENKLNMRFMYYYFENLRPYIEKNYEKGSCNKILNTTDFYDMKICVLPLEEQNKLVAKCNEINETIKKCQNIIKSNEELMNNMITMYIKNNDKEDKEDNKKEKIIKKKEVEDSSFESESEFSSDSDFEWKDKVLDKVKKCIDNEKELKNIRSKYNIPKEQFNDKIKELKKKSK